jgi:hypothetical protein
VIDRDVLRVRLLDILSLFAPRRGWEVDHRVRYWLDRLMEAERPDDGSAKSAPVLEVERLRRRVAELELAFDLERHVVAELEAEDRELERALRERLQRDAHVVAVEAERDALQRQVDAVREVIEEASASVGRPDQWLVAGRVAKVLDTPSTTVVDSE